MHEASIHTTVDQSLERRHAPRREDKGPVTKPSSIGLLPICMTLPKTDVLSTVLQFHRLCRNWCWHSLMPVLAPSPM